MIRDHFRVLKVDLAEERGEVVTLEGRDQVAGGSGLAALLFGKYGHVDKPWSDPDQPLIFAIGPLTGYFPLMSKTVCAFRSPYHDQYAESHAGGRSALSLCFADYDALVITGKAARPSVVAVGSRHLEVRDVHYLWGFDLQSTGKMLRRMFTGSGHRSILRIGPAGERGSAIACINADTYRHFGRLGAGAIMGAKNLKGIVIHGDGSFDLPEDKAYAKLFQDVYKKITDTDMMDKYHNLGTPVNVLVLNGIKALPCRNLQQTHDDAMEGISGEKFAKDTLMRNTACSGCPIGCIHVGFVREKFMEPNQYLYRQISYDHEPIFAAGSMLGVTDAFKVLALIDITEKMGLDVMSAGVALAWATEALEKGLISEKETLVGLRFGESETYKEGLLHLGRGENEFYRLLGQGVLKAAKHYGGEDFACALGQEMAGYATGEVFFISQALGFRHSHLDAGGYSYDQKHQDKDVERAVNFLVQDEQERVLLTSLVSCLFAREVYKREVVAECLGTLGYTTLAGNLETVAERVQKQRWKLRVATGFDPFTVEISKRFTEVSTWKGKVDADYLKALQKDYARRIMEMGKEETDERS
jgi:aldehyde:ferredoxin oxidoreductase